jgi:hypothetical protein
MPFGWGFITVPDQKVGTQICIFHNKELHCPATSDKIGPTDHREPFGQQIYLPPMEAEAAWKAPMLKSPGNHI